MIGYAIKNRKIIFYLLFVIFIGGIYAYITMPKQEAPDLSAPVARITAVYPGASGTDVDKFVTTKIEEELMNMEEFDYLNSYTYNSVVTVIVFMEYGSDIDKTWTKLRRIMADLENDLPDEVMPLEIDTDLTETAGMIIALTGEGYDYDELSFYGEGIISELKKIDGVTKFEMIGEIGQEVKITLDTEELNRLGLSLGDISNLLRSQNLEIPSGSIETDDEDIPLRINGSFDSLDDIENIVLNVSRDNYSVLKLGDIARVEFEEESASTVYRRNGSKAVLLVGYFENNRNVLSIGREVRQVIKDVKSSLPESMEFGEVIFQPEEVENSINGFMMNLLTGIGLVILVVFFGMGFRNALIVSFAIPVSIMATILMMPVFDIKIHAISIAAFIVALGMLVDNAIVVSDSIQNKLDEGLERFGACVEGTSEVIISILTSTLTTVAAFSPLIMLSSIAGDYVQALPQVVILALSFSFLFAFLVTPSLAFVFFKPKGRGEKRSDTLMASLLTLSLKKKFLSFALGLVLLSGLGATFYFANIIFFPKADKEIIYIDIKAEKNIDTDYTKLVTDQVEAIVSKHPEIINMTTAIGGSVPKYYDTLGVYAAIPENAQMVLEVDLEGSAFVKNTDLVRAIQKDIDSQLLDGSATVKELEYAEPIGAPIYIRVTGPDMDSLWETTKELEEILDSVQGSTNVRTDYNPFVYEYELVLDEEKVSYYGLLKYDVLNEVSIALSGRDVSVFRQNGNEYDIRLSSDAKSIEALENLMIKSSATNQKHLLKDLGSISLKKVRPAIRKYNGENTIILMSDIEPGFDARTIEKAFLEETGSMDLGQARMDLEGESAKIVQYFGNLGATAAFAVLLILTILLFQFRSYKQAFIIMLTLPLSAAGAIFGLFLMDQPISFTGMLGIISLIGIVVNNAIVLMEYINMKRRDNMSVDEACISASVVRFRPIILSTVTTVTGLLPLMFSNSELFKPMAVCLVFGLLISTFLTLVFIPLTYSVLHHQEA